MASDYPAQPDVAIGGVETDCDADSPPIAARANRHRLTPIRATLLAAILVGGGYTAYQRIGTTANADLVVYVPNLAGGFAAIGRTADQPGFLLLSRLDQRKVTVDAQASINRIAGSHTTVAIETPTAQWVRRLRGPQLILIDESGAVRAVDVNWTLADLENMDRAMDCETGASKRCGAPFADLVEHFDTLSVKAVPAELRAFLRHDRIAAEHDTGDHNHAHDHRAPGDGGL